jgi:hypothetical protein
VRTLGLKDAAAFLKVHPEELRRRAKAGKVPAAKVGRAWVFLDIDLAEYLRSLYGQPRQALRVTFKEEELCHYADAAAPGGSTSSRREASEYAALLGLPIEPSRKSSTTS